MHMVQTATSARSIPRWYGMRLVHNFMRKRLRLPRAAAERLSHGILELQNRAEVCWRRELAREIGAAAPVSIDPQQGFARCTPEAFPQLSRAAAECAGLYERLGAAKTDKPFFAPVGDGAEVLRLPAVRELVFSDAMIACASRYLGEVPVLGDVALILTVPNQTNERSQKYHFDFVDSRQAKLVLNAFDTGDAHGPFTWLPADVSRRIAASEGYRRERLEDAAVLAHCPEPDWLRLTGPAGSAAVVDTSRCLHFGSRGNRFPRLVLFVQYVSLLAPELCREDWCAAADELAQGLTERQRLLLRLR
jgi:hypothetical protein